LESEEFCPLLSLLTGVIRKKTDPERVWDLTKVTQQRLSQIIDL
jgi:hypothetical protein